MLINSLSEFYKLINVKGQNIYESFRAANEIIRVRI